MFNLLCLLGVNLNAFKFLVKIFPSEILLGLSLLQTPKIETIINRILTKAYYFSKCVDFSRFLDRIDILCLVYSNL